MMTGQDSKSSETVTKSQSLEITATGNGDGVDHDQDLFVLLLNPAVVFDVSQLSDGGRCGPANVRWNFGVSSAAGVPELYKLYVGWLRHPAKMPVDVAQRLKLAGFDDWDYQNILSMDPFSQDPGAVDPA